MKEQRKGAGWPLVTANKLNMEVLDRLQISPSHPCDTQPQRGTVASTKLTIANCTLQHNASFMRRLITRWFGVWNSRIYFRTVYSTLGNTKKIENLHKILIFLFFGKRSGQDEIRPHPVQPSWYLNPSLSTISYFIHRGHLERLVIGASSKMVMNPFELSVYQC